MTEPVRLHGVSKRYGPRSPWVLRGVDLELPAGSLVRVDGANGSGKSTLLSIVAGIGKPNRGRVTGGGRKAFVPERLPTVLPYDVTEYLLRLGAVHGLAPAEAARRATHWLGRLGALTWARSPMAALSRGTAQKVAISQALMADADTLVLDEAWAGLDAEARAVLDGALGERLAAGATVLFVDHQHTTHAGREAEVRIVRDGLVVPAPRPAAPPLDLTTGSAPGPATRDGLIEIEFEDGVARRTVRVPAEVSDDTLRQVLAQPRAHVRAVRSPVD